MHQYTTKEETKHFMKNNAQEKLDDQYSKLFGILSSINGINLAYLTKEIVQKTNELGQK